LWILDDHLEGLLPKKFEWYTAHTISISLIPIGRFTGIHSQKIYSLENDTLTLAIEQEAVTVATDGMIVIEHEAGDLLIMECFD
jgi:thiamine pyrophosphokinase